MESTPSSCRTLARFWSTKALIGREGLLQLLSPQIEEGVDFLREMARKFNGELKPVTTVLAVKGFKATPFLHWLDRQFDNESVMLAAEPDHFVIAPNPDATVTIVEQLGSFVSLIKLPAYDGAAIWDAAVVDQLLPESEYQFRRLGRMTLTDGTLVGRMLTQLATPRRDSMRVSPRIFRRLARRDFRASPPASRR